MGVENVQAPKNCVNCGREITWRKKWEKDWDQVKYCGEKCRRNKGDLLLGWDTKIITLLHSRPRTVTICPSELLPLDQKQDQVALEQIRQAARRLVHQGQIEIVQGGRVVDPSSFRGPIRLRLKL